MQLFVFLYTWLCSMADVMTAYRLCFLNRDQGCADGLKIRLKSVHTLLGTQRLQCQHAAAHCLITRKCCKVLHLTAGATRRKPAAAACTSCSANIVYTIAKVQLCRRDCLSACIGRLTDQQACKKAHICGHGHLHSSAHIQVDAVLPRLVHVLCFNSECLTFCANLHVHPGSHKLWHQLALQPVFAFLRSLKYLEADDGRHVCATSCAILVMPWTDIG